MTDTPKQAKVNDAPVRQSTRAEYIKGQHFYNGKWHATNGAEVGGRDYLLRRITEAEEAEKDLARIERVAASAYAAAQRAMQQASHNLNTMRENLDIYKMALAEEMEIPR